MKYCLNRHRVRFARGPENLVFHFALSIAKIKMQHGLCFTGFNIRTGNEG